MKDEELEKEIERVKQKLSDYQRISPLLRVSGEAYDRQINMMLDDLSLLLKKRKSKKPNLCRILGRGLKKTTYGEFKN